MRAAVYTNYGSPEVLKVQEMEKPSIGANEVLIKIHATTLTSGDVRMRRGHRKSLPLWPVSKLAIGFFKPRNNVLGFDFSGVIEAIGADVSKHSVGDQVFGLTHRGTNAEYIVLSEDAVFIAKPNNVTFDQATSLTFGGATANYFLKKGNIQKGDKVLVYGASGSVGTAAIQIAKYFGAEVTGVCSTKNLELVKSLGADHVIDYTQDDYSNGDVLYDVIFETVGKSPYKNMKKVLKKDGVCLMTVFSFNELFQTLGRLIIGSKKIIVGVADETFENLELLKKLVESGTLTPVIDKTYKLEEIVQAHQYVETGRKVGNVIINFD